MVRLSMVPLLALLFPIPGCTACLEPRCGDPIETCETQEDCEQPDDKRYETVCQFGPSHEDLDPQDVEMVCVAAFKNITCAPGHPGLSAIIDTIHPSDYASPCEGDQAGTMGCPGPCMPGLALNDTDVCDDDDPSTPPAIRGTVEHAGQDVLDQYCRFLFCDQDFVCDTNGHACKPCDPESPYGEGGCGDLYIDGERSCRYRSEPQVEGEDCKAPDVDTNAPVFGDCDG